MKLINLIQIKNVFKPDMKFKDIQVGYKVMKFLKSIENDTNFYNTKLTEIVEECAEKDGDKIKTAKNGNLILAKDKISEWNSKIADLANIEVEVNLPSFKLEDFAECDFTLEELSILEFLIIE
ncbi:MAG: hypothetical protein IJD55_00215 [Clostridia bacterium]|nr:hypothetical protein [Clostridia bacterium]